MDIIERNWTTRDTLMQTVKLFKLGNAQAVRIPARFRFASPEVEIFQRGDELVLRPKTETGADLFARIRAKHEAVDVRLPERGKADPVEPLEL